MPAEAPIPLSSHEIALLQDREFFRAKAAIGAKVRQWLVELRDRLKVELAHGRILAPSGIDLTHGQFVKGEHLDDLPYQYLDFPKYYAGTDKCAFRTLFWWGHQVVFALILEGRYLEAYRANLVRRYDRISASGLVLLRTPTPWEWRRDPERLLELRPDNRAAVAAALGERAFVKIHRYLAFDDSIIAAGRLADAGVAAFQAMRPIIDP